ncbi:hypothetical protein [Streptacidiphilus albus]|uniref:hypothetical protein n=1 Tax=Streptacidiphilus albus TaxID=105425 RepID=UPI00054BE473|nr:hypothetical protein [Streptacidiphilus albus]
MSVMSKLKRAALATGTATLLAGTAVLATSGMASAATPHVFKLCAKGNYTAFASIPQQGGFATVLITPGHCQSLPVLSTTTYGDVWGLYNTGHHAKFLVGQVHFKAGAGWSGAAEGKTNSAHLVKLG